MSHPKNDCLSPLRGLVRTISQRVAGPIAIALDAVLNADERICDETRSLAWDLPANLRVACFSPYAMWQLHSTWEFTVLNALERRGCKTHLLLCDGISPACDLFWDTQIQPWDRCLVCQNRTTQIARLLRQPFIWLSRYIDQDARLSATQWAASVPDDCLTNAVFEDAAIGSWVKGSVHSHFRLSQLNLGDPRVRDVYRQYLTGAAVTLVGCRAMLTSIQPDVLWLFNGRQSLTRVAFEVARSLGIKVICHERGPVHNSVRILQNERCSQYVGLRRCAMTNRLSPLTPSQISAATAWVGDRRSGRNLNWRPFVKRTRNKSATLAKAGINDASHYLLALTSSDDEFVAELDRNKIFPEQFHWLQAIIKWAGDNPNRRTVIRFHPNTSKTSWRYLCERLSFGETASTNEKIFQLGSEITVVPPNNPLDTYALIDACAVATTYGTTAGVEAAAIGKSVIVADDCWYHGMPFVQSAESPEHFDSLLAAIDLTQNETFPTRDDIEVATGALRFIWDYVLGPSIKSRRIRQRGIYRAYPAYRTDIPSELDYGKDAGIDRITDIILGKRPVYDTRPAGDAETADSERQAVVKHLERYRVS